MDSSAATAPANKRSLTPYAQLLESMAAMSSCTPIIITDAHREAARAFVVDKALEPRRVVVALSGGVDSSVVAWLMKEAGHDVIGVSLRLAPDDPQALKSRQGRCCSFDDMTDARQVCDWLKIPFYAIDARARFKEAVFDPFVRDYRNGLTPIPCLACNHEVKFGDLFRTAQSLDADLATGHYAQVVNYQDGRAIARPVDTNRDQTYYLYGTDAEVVKRLHFPLGAMTKPVVRALAEQIGLKVSKKPDSQEICFVPDGDHAKVVERASGPMPGGELVWLGGKKISEHKGIHHFTIGQRRGIGVGVGERAYVLDVNPDNNQVTLGTREDLACNQIQVKSIHAMVSLSSWPTQVSVQIRARSQAELAEWKLDELGCMTFSFAKATHAVALGQAAVVYDGNVLLGGGIITARLDGAVPR